MAAILFNGLELFEYIVNTLSVQQSCCYRASFGSNGPKVWEEMSKIDFRDGSCGGHLGFSINSVLAILCLLGTLILLIKFQFNWIIVFRRDVQNMNSHHFSHIIVQGPYKCMGKQILPCSKKVKRQCRTIILAILVDLPSPIICAKIVHGSHLGQWTVTILAIFCSPAPKRPQHWPGGFRKVVWNSQHFSHTNVWGPYKCIGKQTWPHCKKVKRKCTNIILAQLW